MAGFNRADNPRRTCTCIAHSITVLQVAPLVEEKETAPAPEGETPGGHDRHRCQRRPRPPLPPLTRNSRRPFDEPTSRQKTAGTPALTSSDPGVTSMSTLNLSPAFFACSVRSAHLCASVGRKQSKNAASRDQLCKARRELHPTFFGTNCLELV